MEIGAFAGILAGLGGAAALTEAVVQVIKLAIPADKKLTDSQVQILAAVVGVAMSLLFVKPGLDNVATNVAVQVLAGLLVSRGSNYIHDVATALRAFAEQKKAQAAVAQSVKAQYVK